MQPAITIHNPAEIGVWNVPFLLPKPLEIAILSK